MAVDKTETSRVPKLRVSYHTKVANDFQHTKDVMDHLIGSATFLEEVINPSTRDIRVLYEAYNNRLPDEYFRYVLNPMNSPNTAYTNWPAKLRPYSIIRPNIDLIHGEFARRPFLAFSIKVHNADAVNTIQDSVFKQILASVEQQFINSLNEAGQETGMPSQEVELPAKIKARHLSNYRDERAVMGETALNIVIDAQHLSEKLLALFDDWTIAGEVYSYKGIRGGRMVYERVSPIDIDFDKSPDVKYIEDGQWAARRMYMTPSEVYDNFYKELTETQIDLIEDQSGGLSFQAIGTAGTLRNEEDLRRSKIVVYHLVWKYLTKLGIMSYPNPSTGEMEEMEVPETYKPSEGESVEWYWCSEVWEGYRIGIGSRSGKSTEDESGSDALYVGIKPIEGQRNTVNNMSQCKLPINGKRFSDTHSQNTSPVELGLPYETLHRILHFQMEKTIAKSKGKIVLMDQGAIPKKHGWTEDKFFYWADATGWALIDRTQPGADKSWNQYTVLDMGLYEHINNLIQLMEFIKQEWDEVLGITRQRKGQVNSSDTVGGTQTAVSQSTVMSERIFASFEEFIESELRGLLDLSKIAWSDGFQSLYQSDDMRNTILNIEPTKYCEADMGVYISRSARDLQNLEVARQQVQAFAQNGVNPSTIVDILQARSLSKLKIILQEAEMKSMEAQGQANLSEQEGEERLEMIRGNFAELQGLIDERLVNAEYDRKEELEHIKGAYSTYKNVEGTGDNNGNGVPDALEVRKQFADEGDSMRKGNLDREKMKIQERQKDRELDFKDKELKVKKQIADKQASVALKNKTNAEAARSKK